MFLDKNHEKTNHFRDPDPHLVFGVAQNMIVQRSQEVLPWFSESCPTHPGMLYNEVSWLQGCGLGRHWQICSLLRHCLFIYQQLAKKCLLSSSFYKKGKTIVEVLTQRICSMAPGGLQKPTQTLNYPRLE